MPKKKTPPPPPVIEDDEPDQDDTQDEPEVIEQEIAAPAPPGPNANVPSYLRALIDLPGIDPDVLTGIRTRTAWIKIESAEPGGPSRTMPLAHLAPEALDVLAHLGFEGFTNFEIRDTQAGRPLAYFACELDELEDDGPGAQATDVAGQPGAGGMDPQLGQLLRAQQMQIQQLAAQIAAMQSNPFASLDQAMLVFGKFARFIQMSQPQGGGGGIRQVLDFLGNTVVPVLRGGGADDDQAEEEPEAPEGEQPE